MRLTPFIEAASDWLDAHVAYDDWRLFGVGVVMEPRCAPSILEGFLADGPAVRV